MRLRGGVWFDPNCPRCEQGWINWTDDKGYDKTLRCYDCEAHHQAMKGAKP